MNSVYIYAVHLGRKAPAIIINTCRPRPGASSCSQVEISSLLETDIDAIFAALKVENLQS